MVVFPWPSECDDVIRCVGASAEAESSRLPHRTERSLMGCFAPRRRGDEATISVLEQIIGGKGATELSD